MFGLVYFAIDLPAIAFFLCNYTIRKRRVSNLNVVKYVFNGRFFAPLSRASTRELQRCKTQRSHSHLWQNKCYKLNNINEANKSYGLYRYSTKLHHCEFVKSFNFLFLPSFNSSACIFIIRMKALCVSVCSGTHLDRYIIHVKKSFLNYVHI